MDIFGNGVTMLNLGNKKVGETLRFAINTLGTNGAPSTFSSEEQYTVLRMSDLTISGEGLTFERDADPNSLAGLHAIIIDTSEDDDFYVEGDDYAVYIIQGTVNGRSLANLIVASFSLRAPLFDELREDHEVDGSIGEGIGLLVDGPLNGWSRVILVIEDATGRNVTGASVVITTDLAGLLPIRKLVTDSNGRAFTHLEAGTYYRWAYSGRAVFSNPQSFVVT